jgi:phospholipase C
MLENRSFDHMLGHLSLEGSVPGVDGLTAPLSQYANLYAGDVYHPFKMKDRLLDSDLPHEWDEVDAQLARSAVSKRYTMAGFVESYARFRKMADVGPYPDPMGYFPSDQVPVTSFLARSYCTCDRWFSPIPTSTHPNRTMAWCGASRIYTTGAQLIPSDGTLLDWMDQAGVRWRVYHDGLSCFALFPDAWEHLLGEHFRDYESYLHDMQLEPVSEGPQVIVVEPSYQNAPHLGSDRPNDNHAPLAVGWGEEFLRRTYEAARVNPERWAKTVMIVYYDEHGGFFDHVAPLEIPYRTGGSDPHQFATTGPRVPAIIVSPLVARGSVSHVQLDHTSVLQLLAELFTPGKPYSPDVEARRAQGIASVSALLGDAPRADAPPPPTQPIAVETVLGRTVTEPPSSKSQSLFERAAQELLTKHPDLTAQKYPELHHWMAAVETGRGQKG